MTDEEAWVRFIAALMTQSWNWSPGERRETSKYLADAADSMLVEYKKRFSPNTAYRG